MKYARPGAAAAALSFCFATAAAPPTAAAPTAALPTQALVQIDVAINVDSGLVANQSTERCVVYSTAVALPNAAWVRVAFDDVTRIGVTPPGGEPTVIRVTSVFDGASQSLNARHLREWNLTSAYFNGGVLRIEIIADPGAGESRVAMSHAMVGPLHPRGRQSICDGVDDRELSDDPRLGRLMPVTCTAWIFDDPNRCFLTAGHCTGSGAMTMQFNVPLSDENGNVQHPGPEDQYAVDQVSIQNGGIGIGNDWGYFGCFANTETGLTPAQAQGDFFVLADSPPPVSKQDIRITGYGGTGEGVPREWHLAQKAHAAPYVGFTGTIVSYVTDTTAGNSGSPVIDEETGLAIGIHTHGGCNPSGGSNRGTGSNHKLLRNAIANPQGVCVPSGTPGDVDGDGDADFQDIVAVIAAWGPCDDPPAKCPADLDQNGVVNFQDLLLVIANWS